MRIRFWFRVDSIVEKAFQMEPVTPSSSGKGERNRDNPNLIRFAHLCVRRTRKRYGPVFRLVEETRTFLRISNSIFRVRCDASRHRHWRTRVACRRFNACPIPRRSATTDPQCRVSRIELSQDRGKMSRCE